MPVPNKEIIYIDAEDDITSVIDKLSEAKAKVVALVPPKRSPVVSSVVNLKLLNKVASEENKRVVLITTDKTIMSLAGGVGMYVAANQQSAPAIPAVDPPSDEIPSEVIHEPVSGNKKILKKNNNRGEKFSDSAQGAAAGAASGVTDEAKKKIKIPNFDLFKKRIFLIGAGLIALIALLFWAFRAAPTAYITLKGETSSVATDLTFTVDTGVDEADNEAKVLPATSKEIRRDISEQATATGEKNIGEKATGEMTVYNCSDNEKIVPAGTRFTSNSLTFVTTKAVEVEGSNFFSNGTCKKDNGEEVSVVAENPGDQYNLAKNTQYSSNVANIGGIGSAMAGGTNNIVKILSQGDVDAAKDTALSKAREGAKEELLKQFEDDIYILEATYKEVVGDVSPSSPVGSEASNPTVKVSATFFVLGVDKDQLEDLMKTVQGEGLGENQAIVETGIDDARIEVVEAPAANKQILNLKTQGFAGPDVDLEKLSEEVAGMGFGEAKKHLEDLPGVTEAQIDLSPFWVFSIPSRADHVEIKIEVNE